MFNNIDDIYDYIGQCMINALPDIWDGASFYALMLKVDKAMQSTQEYWVKGTKYDFDVNKINGVAKRTKCAKAFYSLYHIMQRHEQDVPWNKARFELTPNGDFLIDFKYDEDFAYLNSLNPDEDKYPSSDEILAIESWCGLPADYQRYWKK